jgi:uncharacterized membrane protein
MTSTEQLPELAAEERNTAIGVYATQQDAEQAIRALERDGFDMRKLSVLARGMSEERHVIGTDTAMRRTGRWASWGGLWGVLFGALFWVPAVGHVAVGGYLLWLLTTGVAGTAGGALGGALTSLGIPREGILRYESDLRADKWLLVAHGTPAEIDHARAVLAAGDAERVDTHVASRA